jgi:hypothetical protein
MNNSRGAARRARMTRQLNAITLGLAVSGTAATGVLMITAAANSAGSSANATSNTPAATATAPATDTTTATADTSATTSSLQPAQQAVTTNNSAPAATSGGS